jgi:hypothetical protein
VPSGNSSPQNLGMITAVERQPTPLAERFGAPRQRHVRRADMGLLHRMEVASGMYKKRDETRRRLYTEMRISLGQDARQAPLRTLAGRAVMGGG